MKRVFIAAVLLLCMAGGMFFYYARPIETADAFYFSAADLSAKEELKGLAKAFEAQGKKVTLSDAKEGKSGKFNLYGASDVNHLPKVLDKGAINILWLPAVLPLQDPEMLKDFDVIVVKHIPGFSHLKAVNARTAYIPDAVDITQTANKSAFLDKAMYWGDNEGFSLALFLAGPLADAKVDVFGKGFDGVWPADDIKGDMPGAQDFLNYNLVLVDQSDDDIKDELVNKKIIETINKGGLPFVRFNYGIEKMFGNAVPMYRNEQEFASEFRRLMRAPEEILKRREALKLIADREWSSIKQAQKFIEIFEIMEKKRI